MTFCFRIDPKIDEAREEEEKILVIEWEISSNFSSWNGIRRNKFDNKEKNSISGENQFFVNRESLNHEVVDSKSSLGQMVPALDELRRFKVKPSQHN